MALRARTIEELGNPYAAANLAFSYREMVRNQRRVSTPAGVFASHTVHASAEIVKRPAKTFVEM